MNPITSASAITAWTSARIMLTRIDHLMICVRCRFLDVWHCAPSNLGIDTARPVFLPYNDDWFAVAPGAPHGQTPKLGVLHPSLLPRVRSAARAGRRRRAT